MKKLIFTFASCVVMFAAGLANAQTTEFSAVGNAFLNVANVSDADLANGIAPTFLFFGGDENVANGNLGNATNGAQGGGSSFADGGFNVGNGNGLALYTIDLGSAQFIDSVNVFSQSPGNVGGNRQDFDLIVFGHNDALAFDPSFNFAGDDIVFNDSALDSFAGVQDAITTDLTTIGSVTAVNPGATLFGASSLLANNQEFQFISILADAQGTAGNGGESTVFTEFDVIAGVATPAIPEPSSALLIGLAGTGLLIRRRRK